MFLVYQKHVENLLTNSLVSELSVEGFKQEIDSGLPTYVVSSEPNWFVFEQQNLSMLKSRFIGSSDEFSKKAATLHAEKFGFVFAPFNLGTPPSGDEVFSRIKQFSTQTRPDIKCLDGVSKRIERLGELERELTFWKTERLDACALADQYATPMYKALALLLELPFDLVFSMTRSELTKAITDKCDIQKDTLIQRSQHYCLALIDGLIEFYQPTDANMRQHTTVKTGDILQGLPTSPGIVRGKVRILKRGEENPVVSMDEIIVARMTRPELGTALDVALAYVTDEGGRLCHAAIVSREKNKPCVVGLGNATEVLRSGMVVEVDGSAGTVTVVESEVIV